jgi:hypothetical protein
MKPTTRLIALLWLVVGASIWWTALQGAPTSLSLRFFAAIQVLGGVLLLSVNCHKFLYKSLYNRPFSCA